MKKILCTLILLTFCSQVLFAANNKVGTTGAQFLKIGIGSKPIAMGSAYTALADDIHAVYWNPGGIALFKTKQIMAQHIIWFEEINYEYLALAYPSEKFGTFAISASYLNSGEIEKRSGDTDEPDGTFDATDMALAITYGFKLNKAFGFGLNIKYIKCTIDNYDAETFAADAGFLYKPKNRPLSLGAAIQNIGSEIKYIDEGDPLPLNIKVGAGYKALSNKALTLSLDVNYPNDNDVNAGFGTEYNLKIMRDFFMPLRIGYKTLNDFDLIDGLSAGVGFMFKEYSLDIAWVPYGELGDTYRISLWIKF
ncbi:PorV/PorQ family protein [bacterium]